MNTSLASLEMGTIGVACEPITPSSAGIIILVITNLILLRTVNSWKFQLAHSELVDYELIALFPAGVPATNLPLESSYPSQVVIIMRVAYELIKHWNAGEVKGKAAAHASVRQMEL
jgi:hypothetical protein